jgi:predicted phage-related endonuclease
MIVHDVEQGSAVWKELRGKHYPASLAPAMMGDGYASRAKEMSEYLGFTTKKISSFLQYKFDLAHIIEEEARHIAEAKYLQPFSPLVGTREIEGLPLLASFDGLSKDRRVVWEHKATVKDFDEIPPLFFWQLEQQLLVSGAEKAILMTTHPETRCWREYEYFSTNERRDALLAGWHKWMDDAAAFEPADEVADLSDNVEWQRAVLKYRAAKDILDLAKTNEGTARQELIALADNHSAKGGGLTLTQIQRVGSIDYSQIPALDDIDLDLFRRNGSTSYRVTVDKA